MLDGPMNGRSHGLMVPWTNSPLDGWSNGWMVPQMDNLMDGWSHGCMIPWMHGLMDGQSHGWMLLCWRANFCLFVFADDAMLFMVGIQFMALKSHQTSLKQLLSLGLNF